MDTSVIFKWVWRMDEEDIELELIKMRKLAQLQRLMMKRKKSEEEEVKKSPEEILNKWLTGKAREVLSYAREQFPMVADQIVKVLARFIEEGKVKEPINGYDLYRLFYDLGYRIRLPIRIYYEKKGERKPLSELFKEK